jgi:hypothetical protein
VPAIAGDVLEEAEDFGCAFYADYRSLEVDEMEPPRGGRVKAGGALLMQKYLRKDTELFSSRCVFLVIAGVATAKHCLRKAQVAQRYMEQEILCLGYIMFQSSVSGPSNYLRVL